MYSKIKVLIITTLEPLVIDRYHGLNDENIGHLDEVYLKLPGSDLQKCLGDCIELSLLTERQQIGAKIVIFSYISSVEKSPYERFPEIDFMFNNSSFLDPCVRQLQKAVEVERFFTVNETFIFDENNY